jgi:hypothetical protein
MDSTTRKLPLGTAPNATLTSGNRSSSNSSVELQQQRAAKVLAALEKQISERVDKDFFAEEVLFRCVGWQGGREGGREGWKDRGLVIEIVTCRTYKYMPLTHTRTFS